ncbi:MAG: hypothetical protein AAGM84_08440 [Pseudomonadota bacterium]
MRNAFISSIAALVATTASGGAISDVSCDDRTRLVSTLTQTMGAHRQGTGLRDPETMLEVWVMPTNGDWLIVQHYATGTSCIVAMGAHWEGAAPDPA